MQITIDTNNLSELDLNMLAFLAEQGEPSEPQPEEEQPEEAPKAAPKAKANPEAKPEPTPEPEEEDLVGGATVADAIAAATALVSSGGAAKVKAALATVNVKRVSEMKDADVPTFLAALEAE